MVVFLLFLVFIFGLFVCFSAPWGSCRPGSENTLTLNSASSNDTWKKNYGFGIDSLDLLKRVAEGTRGQNVLQPQFQLQRAGHNSHYHHHIHIFPLHTVATTIAGGEKKILSWEMKGTSLGRAEKYLFIFIHIACVRTPQSPDTKHLTATSSTNKAYFPALVSCSLCHIHTQVNNLPSKKPCEPSISGRTSFRSRFYGGKKIVPILHIQKQSTIYSRLDLPRLITLKLI